MFLQALSPLFRSLDLQRDPPPTFDEARYIEAALRDQATDANQVIRVEKSVGGDQSLLTVERAVGAISQVVEAETQYINPLVIDAMSQTLS